MSALTVAVSTAQASTTRIPARYILQGKRHE